MKKVLALSVFFSLLAVGVPAAAQNQTQIGDCNPDLFAACTRECSSRNLSTDVHIGCIIGCGIASGCG